MTNSPASTWPELSPRFMTTRWTMVLQAGGDGPEREAAMEQFCRAYWYPVYAFIRRRGHDPEDARDLTQGFFAKLLKREWLNGIEKRDARFSSYLLTRVKTHLMNEHRDATTQKRGGDSVPISIEMAQAEEWFGAEPVIDETPERSFERRWALAVLDAAMKCLREECDAANKTQLFDQLSPFLSREPEPGEYAALAIQMKMRENTLAVAVHRLRQQYREAVRAEVSVGLADSAMIEAELRHLAECL